jgi:hypothetical protein
VLDAPEATTPPGLEKKASSHATTTDLVAANDSTGVVEALVSVTGIKDEVNDIIIPGAYKATLAKRKPKGVFCADEATEILTERGWLRYDEVTAADRAYALNPETLTARFEPVLAVNVFDAEPREVRLIETSGFSSLTTLDHRWPVRRRVKSADGGYAITWRTTRELDADDGIIRSLANTEAPVEAKWSDAFVEVVAWAWNEGHLGPQSNAVSTPRLTIAQSIAVNPLKCASIRRALTAAFPGGFHEHRCNNGRGMEFRLNKGPTEAVAAVLGEGNAPLPEFLCSLTAAQLHLLIDTCMDGDGHVEASGTARWAQRSEHGLRAFEMACALAGIPTNTCRTSTNRHYPDNPCNTVTMLRRNTCEPLAAIAEAKRTGKPPRVARQDVFTTHDGVVWCPTTPSGTWLARRNGSVYFTGNSHDWGRWVARTEAVEEWMPGDPRLPDQTKDGQPWPKAAGALYVRMRFNLKSREGRDAYENVKFFSETGECEWSIGYHVPDGKGVRDKEGIRHIKELELFEYSPVLFGAAPLSGTLAVKSRLAAMADEHEDVEAAFERFLHEEGLKGLDLDEVEDAVAGLRVAEIVRKELAEMAPSITPEALAEAFGEVGVEEWADDDEVKALDSHEWRVPILADVDDWVAIVLTEAKFDPTGTASTRAPLGEGNNWVKKVGGLPMLMRRVAHHLIDKGRPESVAVATAVNWCKKMCATGRAFGGKVKVSKEAQAAACAAVAEWDKKKAESHAGKALLAEAEAGTIEIPDLEGTGGLIAAKMSAASRHRKPTMPVSAGDNREPYPIGNRDDLKNAIQAYGRAKDEEKPKVKRWIVRRARAIDAVDMLPEEWNVTKDDLDAIEEFKAFPVEDQRRAKQLVQWYERGGGAALIRWNEDGAYDRAVEIAGKHMDGEQAKAFAALRQRGAAGPAPIEHPQSSDVLDTWMPEAEIGEYASTKAVGADMAVDAKQYPFLAGSFEATQDALRRTLNDQLRGDEIPSGDGEDAGPPRREWNYVEVVGTYDDRVIARRCAYSGPNDGKSETYELTYNVNGDGSVTLGPPLPVVIEVTAEVLSTSTGDENDDYEPDDGEDETSPGPQYLVLGALKSIEQVALSVQIANDFAAEVKAGRVLSGANEERLRAAVEHLVAVLKAAGVSIDASGDSNPDALTTPPTDAPSAVVTKGAGDGETIDIEALRGRAAETKSFLASRASE